MCCACEHACACVRADLMQCSASASAAAIINGVGTSAVRVTAEEVTKGGNQQRVFTREDRLHQRHAAATLAARSHRRAVAGTQPSRHPRDLRALQTGDVGTEPDEVRVVLRANACSEHIAHRNSALMVRDHAANEVDRVVAAEADAHAGVHRAVDLELGLGLGLGLGLELELGLGCG